MKLQLNLFWLLPLMGLNFGCSCDILYRTPDKVIASLNESDSLKLMDSLFNELKNEIYTNLRYEVPESEYDDMIYCGLRHQLVIKVNYKNEILIGRERNGDISSLVTEYFGHNMDVNDPTNNFPMYSRITHAEIDNCSDMAMQEARKCENTKGAIPEIIEYKWMIVEEWKKKKKALEFLGIEELPEPHGQSHIQLEYPSNYAQKDSILNQILSGYFALRNKVAQRYFKKSYLEIYYSNLVMHSYEDQNQLLALDFLCPIRVVDRTFCRENNIRMGRNEPPPPPMLEDPL